MRRAALASQPDHRRRAGDRHRRRRLYRGSWVADADVAGRSCNARRGRGGAEGSPGPRARPSSQRDLRTPARRNRRRVADGACYRSHVDDDPCGCVPGDPRRPNADTDSLLGISSPFIATAGDVLMTVIFATLLILPARLLWRRLTRPVERMAWSLRLGAKAGTVPMNRVADWLIGRWLESRFGFAMRLREGRTSLAAALILVLRLGLPVTAFFVAFNPIWGFTWYFNTESWATGVYQKMTQLRVDPWRVKMIDAVTRVYGGDGDGLFRVDPRSLQGGGDFSFLVIGDPGEGDASQYSLVSRYLELGRRDDVKFLVVSSDVIYPAGSMHDYEA